MTNTKSKLATSVRQAKNQTPVQPMSKEKPPAKMQKPPMPATDPPQASDGILFPSRVWPD